MDDSEVLEWKNKYENAERSLLELKKLAHKGVGDYEDLHRKYDQNQKQYEELKQKLRERETQLVEVEKLLGPAVQQYDELNVKYEVANNCRNEAERYATRMVQSNKKLKRQSQFIIQKMAAVDMNIEELAKDSELMSEETVQEEEKVEKDRDELYKIIEGLEEKAASLQTQLSQAQEERDDLIEKEKIVEDRYLEKIEALHRTDESLKQHKDVLRNFKRVSTKAFDEYENLKSEYEKEKLLKDTAEEYARKMVSDRNTAVRQSSALVANVSNDEKLMKSMMEIEDLNTKMHKLQEENGTHQERVRELEAAFRRSQEVKQVSDLEEQLQLITEHVEQLERQNKELEKWKDKVEKENIDLVNKLDVAEQKLKPPPPPPPPPLPPIGFLKPVYRLLTGKPSFQASQKAANKKDPLADKYSGAIDEMMNRIKSGHTLRRIDNTRRRPGLDEMGKQPSLPTIGLEKKPDDDDSAMQEMHKFLTKLKRSHSLPDGGLHQHGEDGESELQKVFNKIQPQKKGLSLIQEEDEARRKSSSNCNNNNDSNAEMTQF